MMAAVLYGKEDVRLESVPFRSGRWRDTGPGPDSADLRNGRKGFPPRLSREHDRAAGGVRARTGR